MKAILTLFFVAFFGITALAQDRVTHDKVEPIKMDIVLDISIDTPSLYNEVKTSNQKDVARVYKFKNSRVKKALAFTTKRNRAKLA